MNMSKQQQEAGDNSSQFQADTIIQNFYSSPNKSDNTQIMNGDFGAKAPRKPMIISE